MSTPKMLVNLFLDKKAHGRTIYNRDYTMEIDGTQRLTVTFNDTAEARHVTAEGQYEFGGINFKVTKLSSDFARVHVKDDPIVLDPNYIDPATASTPARKAWLALQEYFLTDDYSRRDAICNRLDNEFFARISKTHPHELPALVEIISEVERDEVIRAIIGMRELTARIEGRSPASAPEPVNA